MFLIKINMNAFGTTFGGNFNLTRTECGCEPTVTLCGVQCGGRGAASVLSNFKIIFLVKGKINCNLVQALRLCTGSTVRRGSRGIAVLYRH